MPPLDHRMPCSPLAVTTATYNVTTKDTGLLGNEDLNALLYIVVTLLFYSLGIIIGIISYLKREKRELEESKTFEIFMSLKNDPFTATKLRRVQVVTERLEQLERKRAVEKLLEENADKNLTSEGQSHEGETTDASEDETDREDTPLTKKESDEREKDNDTAVVSTTIPASETLPTKGVEPRRLQLKKQANVFQVSPSGEPISSVVAKIFESERRGGLPNSPKALHLFKARGHLSRDYSMDSPGRGSPSSEQSPDKAVSFGGADIEMVPQLRNSERREVSTDAASSSDNASSNNEKAQGSPEEPDGCLVTNV